MLDEISLESKQSITSGLLIWFSIFSAQFIYLFLCYFILKEHLHHAIYDPRILNDNIFMNIDIHALIYIFATIILICGYLFYKKRYSKLVLETLEKNFDDMEKEFNYFKKKYMSLMFNTLAIFELIAILGIVIFLTTLNITITTNLIIICVVGFFLVIPTKNKFDYDRFL